MYHIYTINDNFSFTLVISIQYLSYIASVQYRLNSHIFPINPLSLFSSNCLLDFIYNLLVLSPSTQLFLLIHYPIQPPFFSP